MFWPLSSKAQTLLISVELSPVQRNQIVYSVKNTDRFRDVYLLKSSVSRTDGRTVVPNGRYDLIALFPRVDDGRRIEECSSSSYPEGDRTSLSDTISIKPGGVYVFSRSIADRDTPLASRIFKEDFILFWRLSLRYAFKPNEQFGVDGQWANCSVFSGALTVLNEPTSQP